MALPLLLAGLGGGQAGPHIGPNGDGTLLRADDERWTALQSASVAADTEKGEYRATFNAALQRMDGRPIRLSGYMLPVETSTAQQHFVITRRSTGCPFCAPPDLTEAVEIFLTAPIRYSSEPVTVVGRFRLVSHSEAGLFYCIDGATAA